jgi:hypothetical protein
MMLSPGFLDRGEAPISDRHGGLIRWTSNKLPQPLFSGNRSY